MAQRHMDRLTSFDTSFLTNERSNGHMAIGAIMVCEGSAPSHEDFVTHIRSRLHLLPRLRQRLAFPPLHFGTPLWVDHPDFDVSQHVRHVTLPAPGTDAQFHELIGDLLSRRLSIVPSRSGSCGWSTASRTIASGSSTRRTTRWPTGSPRPTSACCSSMSSRRPKSSAEEPVGAQPAALEGAPRSASRRAASSPCSAAPFAGCPARSAIPAGPPNEPRTGSSASGRSAGTSTKPAPKVAFNTDIGPNRALRLDQQLPGGLQTDQERPRRDRQRRHARRDRRRPAPLARGP